MDARLTELMGGVDGDRHADGEGWPWSCQAVQALGLPAAEVVFVWRLVNCPSQLCLEITGPPQLITGPVLSGFLLVTDTTVRQLHQLSERRLGQSATSGAHTATVEQKQELALAPLL